MPFFDAPVSCLPPRRPRCAKPCPRRGRGHDVEQITAVAVVSCDDFPINEATPSMPNRALFTAAAAAKAAPFFLLCTVAIAVLLPVYTDEVGWKILQGRYLQDGFVNISLFPACGSSFATSVPWFMVPYRVAGSWMHSGLHEPLRIRLLGTGHFLAWLALVHLLLPKCLPAAASRTMAFGIITAVLGLGSLPFMMVISRPEQVLLTCVVLMFALPLCAGRAAGWLAAAAAPVVLVAVGGAALASHPKSLFFLPLMLAAAYLLPIRALARAVVMGCITLLSGAGYLNWVRRMSCPDDPELGAALGSEFLEPSRVLSEPTETITTALRNVYHTFNYARNTLFHRLPHTNQFLRPDMTASAHDLALDVLITCIYILCSIVFLYLLYRASTNPARSEHERRLVTMTWAGVISITIYTTIQIVKRWYDASLIIPFCALLLTMLLSMSAPAGLAQRVRKFMPILVLVSTVSQASLIGEFLRSWWSSSETGGYLSGQPISISTNDFSMVSEKVRAAARLCGIDDTTRIKHLVVDDLTYLVFADTFRPFHAEYLMRGRFGKPHLDERLDDFLAFLANSRSDGLIAGCHLLPPGLRARSTADGPYCCLPPF